MPTFTELTPFTTVAIFVGGILCGGLGAFLLLPSRRRVKILRAKLAAAHAEHESYRVRVNEHFEQTSDLVASMTASYKAVYDHLATGARTLCEGREALASERFGAKALVFERDLDIARLGGNPTAKGSDSSTGDAETAARKDDGPVLEMQREEPSVKGEKAPGRTLREDVEADEGHAKETEAQRTPLH